jgi:hypothetical protein
LRRGTGFATLTLLGAVRRVACDGLRLAPEVGFFVFRLMPAALFFER